MCSKRKRPDVVLYHFCPAHMVEAIKREGLRLGAYPIFSENRMELIPKIQWLTAEPDRAKQSWATRNLIPYDRTEYRLTVRIPGSHHKKLVKAREYASELPEKDRGIVLDWPGSEMWYVFQGHISPRWIIGCKEMSGKNDPLHL